MRAVLALSAGLLLLGNSPLPAQELLEKPAAPEVTVGADLKQLLFDWDPVPGATHYKLFYNPDGSAGGYAPLGDPILAPRTRARVNLAVHLVPWATARYKVAACNDAGCTRSRAVDPQELMLDTIGYFKASNTNAADNFGREVRLSLDGRTLAVAAPGERSNASGVNGDQSDDSFQNSGAVYVFRRNAGGWSQEAYLKAGDNQLNEQFGAGYPFGFDQLALSADGSRIAVGATGETVNGLGSAGAVYIYARAADGTWSLEAKVISPAPQQGDLFGTSVEITGDGNTLKVSQYQPRDGEGNGFGRTFFYTHDGTGWQHRETLDSFYEGDFCAAVRMSGDGLTLIQHCYSYSGASPRIVTLKRQGDTWVHAADLTFDGFSHQWPGLSHDGSAFALRVGPMNNLVNVYRWNGAGWTQEANLSGPAPGPGGGPSAFGYEFAFNRTGTMLAVNDLNGLIGGAGVMDEVTPSWDPHGAVLLYERDASAGSWQLHKVIKAPNPSAEDLFGISIAMSGNGRTLAVGASLEDSAATGVDGDQSNDAALDAGAAYLY
jgi:hypothetical protein